MLRSNSRHILDLKYERLFDGAQQSILDRDNKVPLFPVDLHKRSVDDGDVDDEQAIQVKHQTYALMQRIQGPERTMD